MYFHKWFKHVCWVVSSFVCHNSKGITIRNPQFLSIHDYSTLLSVYLIIYNIAVNEAKTTTIEPKASVLFIKLNAKSKHM